MKAFALEYRFRYALHGLIFTLGFWAPWTRYTANPFFTPTTVWAAGCILLARQGWMGFGGAVRLLLIGALTLTALAAWFRIWGTAYVGASIVQSQRMHSDALLADGPYRHTRNPLYLGTWLHALGLALLMPLSGAVLTVVLMTLLQVRLALAEEPFLLARFGEAYGEYARRVPRFLPSIRPRVTSAARQARWGQAVLGETYFVGVFVTLLIAGWSFNAAPILRGILISLGISIILQAFLPRAPKPVAATTA